MKGSRIQAFGLMILLSLIWGSSFILMKKGLSVYSSGQVASLRVTISAAIFLPFVLFRLKSIDWSKLGHIAVFAFLEIGAPPFLFTYAQTHVDSSTSGILNGLTPLFTLLVGILFFRIKSNLFKTAGVLLGFAGAVLLIFFKNRAGGGIPEFNFGNTYGLFIVLATLLYGFGGNYMKRRLDEVPALTTTSLAFVTMGIPTSIYLFTTDFVSIPLSEPANLHAFLAVAALSVFGSSLAILLFSILVKKSSALFAAFVTYLIPFVAMAWGALDGETITASHLIGLAVILAGISVANAGEQKVKQD